MSRSDKLLVLKRLAGYLKRDKALLLLSLLMSLCYVAATLILPILSGKVLDLFTQEDFSFDSLGKLLLKILIATAVAALTGWLVSQFNTRITSRAAKALRCDAFRRLQRQPLSFLDAHPAGDLLSRMTSDVDQLTDGLLLGFSQLFTGVITILGTLYFLFSVNVWIALVVVLLTPLSLLVASFIAGHTFSMHKEMTKSRGELTALINSAVGMQKTIRAFSAEEKIGEKFGAVNSGYREASRRATFYSSLLNPSTRFVNNLVYAGVGFAGALIAIATGSITIGTLTAALTYAGQYAKPFNEISGVFSELQSAIVCAGRVFSWMDEPSESPDGNETLTDADGSVCLQNVSFRYHPDRPLLQHISLSARPGSRIAIVGPTGCGKTTLINLLMRFYDADEGAVVVSGGNVRSWTRESLRSSFGMVLQDTWLKSGTVLDNLRMGCPGATREQVESAARLTRVHNLIQALPQGYDTVLGEDGGTLSGGQKQLLCITRVMLMKPKMLILDEATSSLDTRTEKLVQQAFDTLMQGQTAFIVAHRLSTIQNADLILVINEGKIVEQGRHTELLQKNGFYARLYHSQFENAV